MVQRQLSYRSCNDPVKATRYTRCILDCSVDPQIVIPVTERYDTRKLHLYVAKFITVLHVLVSLPGCICEGGEGGIYVVFWKQR